MFSFSRSTLSLALVGTLALASLSVPRAGQTDDEAATVPQLVTVSGSVPGKDPRGRTLLTFAIYARKDDTTPLWSETQAVVLSAGQYRVVLGRATAGGVPASIFSSGEARWIGLAVEREPELPRTRVTSTPYALKALDAETLGGQPLSAFVLKDARDGSDVGGSNSEQPVLRAKRFMATADHGPGLISTALSGPPLSVVSTDLVSNLNADLLDGIHAGDLLASDQQIQANVDAEAATRQAEDGQRAHLAQSNVFQSPGTVIPQVMGAVDQATNAPDAGFPSNPLDLVASAFSTQSNADADQLFRWQAEPVASNTPSPSGRLTLHYGAGGQAPAPTGLALNADGTISFASGQTFPAGVGDITAVTAGTGLAGGASSGAATLALDVVGFTDVRYPRLATANTFHGDQTVMGTVLATGNMGATNIAASGALSATGAVINGPLGAERAVMGSSTPNQVLLVTQLGTASGVNATTAATDPGMAALHGIASATTGTARGVIGTAVDSADGGVGVQGTGGGTGVVGMSPSGTGIGVAGLNQTPTGETTGLYAQVVSPDGSAAVFQAPGGTSANLIVGKTLGTPGTIRFRVDGAGRAFANLFTTPAADFAESIQTVDGVSSYEPGDVLVIDAAGPRRVDRSQEPYSTRVAGVYSTRPGVLATSHEIDDPRLAEEIPMAIVGIVPCKVSAENGAIRPGDLLVTSATPGHAMKGTARVRMVGAVLGKALESLPEGSRVIQILVTLH
jgi:hypothetical protein